MIQTLNKNNDEKFLKCEIYLKNCKNYLISNKDLVNLPGELKIDNINYQYVGKYIDINLLNNSHKENFKLLKTPLMRMVLILSLVNSMI